LKKLVTKDELRDSLRDVVRKVVRKKDLEKLATSHEVSKDGLMQIGWVLW
jgi:hypothetical protein